MKRNTPSLAALAAVVLPGRAAAAPAKPAPLSAVIDALNRVEAVEMLGAILAATLSAPGPPRTIPPRSEYDWKWLARPPWTPTTTGPSRPTSSPGREAVYHSSNLCSEARGAQGSVARFQRPALCNPARTLMRRTVAESDCAGGLSPERRKACCDVCLSRNGEIAPFSSDRNCRVVGEFGQANGNAADQKADGVAWHTSHQNCYTDDQPTCKEITPSARKLAFRADFPCKAVVPSFMQAYPPPVPASSPAPVATEFLDPASPRRDRRIARFPS